MFTTTFNNISSLIQNVDKVTVSDAISCDTHNCHLLNLHQDKYLSIIHQNIRSISANFDDFLILLAQIKIQCDIIILTECWLSCNSVIPQLCGYTHYKSSKLYNQNDGIVVYYKNDLQITIYEPFFEEGNCLIIKHHTIVIVSIYRPPSFHNTDVFIKSLNNVLETLSSYKNITVMGDINIDIKKCTNDIRAIEYLNLNAHHGFLPAHNLPTRVDACLDHVMLRSNLETTTVVLNSTVTDHQAVILSVLTQKSKITTDITRKKINYEKIKSELESTNFNSVLLCQDANDAGNIFVSFLQHLIESNTVTYTIPNRKRVIKPWITFGILRCIKNRDNLYKKFKSSPTNETLKLTYTRYRNHCKSIIKNAKQKYYINQINKAGKDNQKLWEAVKDLSHTQKTCSSSTNLLNCSDTPVKAINLVNDYFANVGRQLAEKINHGQKISPFEAVKSLPTHKKSFVMLPTDEYEVERLIMGLKNKCSVGWDNIPNYFIKEFRKYLVPPLTHICNLCLNDGVFPQVFKHSIIHPIHKSGDGDRVNNYRPISILPALSKIIEKIINKRLIEYLERNDILSQNQHGFRLGRSTDGAVHELTDYVVKNLDQSNKVIGVFLDLAKAFDTVSIPILLSKMEAYGIRGKQLDLFKDYLNHRTQISKIGNYISETQSIHYGVPQGSILGPTLFLIYINDLSSMQLSNGHIITYADDTCLLFSASTWGAARNAAQLGLDMVNKWLQINMLTLNSDKTKYMTFSMRNLPPESRFNVHLISHNCNKNLSDMPCSCKNLELVSSIKYLGVIIDNNLSFKKHIETLYTRLRKLIVVFKNLRDVIDKKSLTRIYLALAQSLLSYCITSWGGAPKTIFKQIEVAQRAILKVCGSFPFRYSTELLYQHWQVLTVRQIFILHTILKQHSTVTFDGKKSLEARRMYKVCVPFPTKKIYTRKYFCYLGGVLYNKINKSLSIYSSTKYECKDKVENWLISLNYEKTESLLFGQFYS